MTTSVFTYNLTGAVRNQGLGVSKATVYLFDLYSNAGTDTAVASQITGSKGEFSFAVPAGTYMLEVVPDRDTRFLRTTVSEIAVNNNTTCNIAMLTGSILDVKVVTKSGAAVVNGELVALGIEPVSYRNAATASDDGTYTLVLPRAKYHIGFRFPQQPDQVEENDENIQAGEPFISSTVTVFDFERDDSVRFVLPDFVKFDGQVTDLFGVPTANVKVKFSSSAAQENLVIGELGLDVTCQTQADGMFQVLVEPGTYDISIEPGESNLLFAATENGIEILTDMSKKFQLAEGFRLRGQVQYELTPLSHCLVRIQGIDRKVDTIARTDNNGQFSIALPGGNYKLVVSAHPKHAPTVMHEGAEFSGLAPWTKMIVVGGDTHVAVRLLEGTPLNGKITDDRGAARPGLKVSIFVDGDKTLEEDSPVPLASCMTDAEGKYSFFLAPGKYWLAVHTDVANARSIDIGTDPVNLDIDWHGWCLLRFDLVGESEQKIPRCRVGYSPYATANDVQKSLPRGYVLTDHDGVCHLTLPSGVYSLTFTPPPDSSYGPKTIKQISISTDVTRTIKLLPKADEL